MEKSRKEETRTLSPNENLLSLAISGDMRDSLIDAREALDKLFLLFDDFDTDLESGNDMHDSVMKLRHNFHDLCTHLLEARSFMDEGLQCWEADLTNKAAR